MNGAGHYAEAERLMQLSLDQWEKHEVGHPLAAITMQQAQVHATLALVAAQVETCFGIVHPNEGGPRTDLMEAVQ